MRNLIWPVIFFRLHVDQYTVWSKSSYTLATSAAMLTNFVLHCILTYLQFVWGKLVVNNSCEALGVAPPFVLNRKEGDYGEELSDDGGGEKKTQ